MVFAPLVVIWWWKLTNREMGAHFESDEFRALLRALIDLNIPDSPAFLGSNLKSSGWKTLVCRIFLWNQWTDIQTVCSSKFSPKSQGFHSIEVHSGTPPTPRIGYNINSILCRICPVDNLQCRSFFPRWFSKLCTSGTSFSNPYLGKSWVFAAGETRIGICC